MYIPHSFQVGSTEDKGARTWSRPITSMQYQS